MARRRASFWCTPASNNGISTFSTALSTGMRLNDWNTKPIDDARSRVRSASLISWSDAAVEDDTTAVDVVEAGEAVEQCGLARARGAHHRDELTGTHAQVHVPQRPHLAGPGAVDLAHPFRGEQRSGRDCRRPRRRVVRSHRLPAHGTTLTDPVVTAPGSQVPDRAPDPARPGPSTLVTAAGPGDIQPVTTRTSGGTTMRRRRSDTTPPSRAWDRPPSPPYSTVRVHAERADSSRLAPSPRR